MRVSTSTFYELGVGSIQSITAQEVKTQTQLSTGQRLQTAGDDPLGMQQVVQGENEENQNKQYLANIGTAQTQLTLQSSTLSGVTTALQNIQTLAVQANDGALSAADRAALAANLKEQIQNVLGLANTSDGQGGYLFSGYSTTQPFVQNANGAVAYQGDNGQKQLAVGAGRVMPSADPGSMVFDNIQAGNGTFVTGNGTLSGGAVTNLNTGSGAISAGTVSDPANPNVNNGAIISFTDPNTYTVYESDGVTPATDASGNPMTNLAYTPGASLTVDGKTVQISGAPAGGDSFYVAPAGQQGLFATLNNLLGALTTDTTTAAGKGNFATGMAQAQASLQTAINHVIDQSGVTGARLNSLNSAQTYLQNVDTQIETHISSVRDTDYTRAASDLAKEQVALQAAQQSFVKVQGLSLFNYITTN